MSPWYQRINMLGETGLTRKMVSQASWVRNLQATIVKSSEGRRVVIGGLFGAPVGEDRLTLQWNRVQQAAFLIYSWIEIANAIEEFRKANPETIESIPESDSSDSMLNSDIGVRGFLHVLNDLCVIMSDAIMLQDWRFESVGAATSKDEVAEAIESLRSTDLGDFMQGIAQSLADYDWRASKAVGLPVELRQAKARFRGSSGYRELREDLLHHLVDSDYQNVASAAKRVILTLGYER